MLKHNISAIALISSLVLLGGCSNESAETSVEEVGGAVEVRDPVIAKVGNSSIHQSQLSVLIDRLAEGDADKVDAQARQKMVESLVRIRAIADEAEAGLSAEELRTVDAKVQAYRDEILAQLYMKSHVDPRPVTGEMVRNYYDQNIDRFTQKGKVRYRTLSVAKDALTEDTRAIALKAFGAASADQDWKALSEKLNKEGVPAKYRIATSAPDQLEPGIANHVAALSSGKVSDVIFGEQIIVINVMERAEDVVRPLQSVSAEIRKTLVPLQLKEAVAEVSQQVLSKTSVEYVNGG